MFFFASSSAQILTKNFIVQGKVETNKDEDYTVMPPILKSIFKRWISLS
jgi:hypothetical protein